MQGAKIAGGNPATARVEHDYYATDPRAVWMLMERHPFDLTSWLEPCVGAGHIAETVAEYRLPGSQETALDLVYRGYPYTIEQDFLTWETDQRFTSIITNPPYSLAGEFVEKGMSLLAPHGQMAMFMKIQFLEGMKRKELFEKYPPKYIYVFRNRMATWNRGMPIDPATGKKWATTMCHAWFIWENGFQGEPVVRWLDADQSHS